MLTYLLFGLILNGSIFLLLIVISSLEKTSKELDDETIIIAGLLATLLIPLWPVLVTTFILGNLGMWCAKIFKKES